MTFEIGERQDEETYRMRSVANGYPGDLVHHFTRVINGTKYAFNRIRWGGGTVSVGAMKEGERVQMHYFEFPPES